MLQWQQQQKSPNLRNLNFIHIYIYCLSATHLFHILFNPRSRLKGHSGMWYDSLMTEQKGCSRNMQEFLRFGSKLHPSFFLILYKPKQVIWTSLTLLLWEEKSSCRNPCKIGHQLFLKLTPPQGLRCSSLVVVPENLTGSNIGGKYL